MLSLPPLPAFLPHPLIRGGDLQTVLGAALPKSQPPLDRQGGFVRVSIPVAGHAGRAGRLRAWYRPGSVQPAVLLLHGLGGTTRSGYVREGAAKAAAAGHAVLALDHRGSGDEFEETRLPYMAGNTADVRDALRWLREEAQTDRAFAVGYSISGNTLLRYLGEQPADPPEFSVAVCPPIDLDAASNDLRKARTRAYDLWVLRSCRRWIPELTGDAAPGTYRVPALSGLRTFDERYITPVWGFESLGDYYRRASAAPTLHRIQANAAILHASDDPIVSPRVLRHTRRSPSVHVDLIQGGGHLGFLERRQDGRHGVGRWLPRAIQHYLTASRSASSLQPA